MIINIVLGVTAVIVLAMVVFLFMNMFVSDEPNYAQLKFWVVVFVLIIVTIIVRNFLV